MTISDLIKLIRVNQWYKNLVIFLPILFLKQFFTSNFIYIIVGFITLCLISSVNYIINDIIDRKRDQQNKEKAIRPIASGRIRISSALILALILFIISIFISIKLDFVLPILSLFILTLFYSLILKKEPFLDILIISTNFVVRAVTGAIILKASISPWLVLCTFFLALFLSVGKRESEISYLKEESSKHRETLKFYTKDITSFLMIISTTLLILSYSLYSFLTNHNALLLTLPLALYTIFRYFYLSYTGSKIARHPEQFIKDKRLFISIILWIILVFIILYF